MSVYRWNSGGKFRGKEWESNLITDSQVIKKWREGWERNEENNGNHKTRVNCFLPCKSSNNFPISLWCHSLFTPWKDTQNSGSLNPLITHSIFYPKVELQCSCIYNLISVTHLATISVKAIECFSVMTLCLPFLYRLLCTCFVLTWTQDCLPIQSSQMAGLLQDFISLKHLINLVWIRVGWVGITGVILGRGR